MENFVEIKNEEFYAWVAPDGNIQLASIANDQLVCEAFTKLLHKKGIGQSPHQLRMKGFRIQKVKLSVQKISNPNNN